MSAVELEIQSSLFHAQWERVAAQVAVPDFTLHGVELDTWRDPIIRALVVKLSSHVLTHKVLSEPVVVEFTQHRPVELSRWRLFRLLLPRWAGRHASIQRFETLTVEATVQAEQLRRFPEYNIYPASFGKPVIFESTRLTEWNDVD